MFLEPPSLIYQPLPFFCLWENSEPCPYGKISKTQPLLYKGEGRFQLWIFIFSEFKSYDAKLKLTAEILSAWVMRSVDYVITLFLWPCRLLGNEASFNFYVSGTYLRGSSWYDFQIPGYDILWLLQSKLLISAMT